MKVLFFDTETTGLLIPGGTIEEQPHIVQLGAIYTTYNTFTETLNETILNQIYNPGVLIPENLCKLHGISNELAQTKPFITNYLEGFIKMMKEADIIIGHNLTYDLEVIYYEIERVWNSEEAKERLKIFKKQIKEKSYCTMLWSVQFCKIPGRAGYKWPKLIELHKCLFGEEFDNAHNAIADIRATQRCFIELVNRGIIDIWEKVWYFSEK